VKSAVKKKWISIVYSQSDVIVYYKLIARHPLMSGFFIF